MRIQKAPMLAQMQLVLLESVMDSIQRAPKSLLVPSLVEVVVLMLLIQRGTGPLQVPSSVEMVVLMLLRSWMRLLFHPLPRREMVLL